MLIHTILDKEKSKVLKNNIHRDTKRISKSDNKKLLHFLLYYKKIRNDILATNSII